MNWSIVVWLSALACCTSLAGGETPGGAPRNEYVDDPRSPGTRTEIRELVAEGVVPLNKRIQRDDAVPLSSDIRAMIDSGKMQMRLRVEYDSERRLLVVTQYVVNTGEPMLKREAPAARSASVLQMTESTVDALQFLPGPAGTVAILGWIRAHPVAALGEMNYRPVPLVLSMHYENEGPTLMEGLTVSVPGAAATAPVAAGIFSTVQVPVGPIVPLQWIDGRASGR